MPQSFPTKGKAMDEVRIFKFAAGADPVSTVRRGFGIGFEKTLNP